MNKKQFLQLGGTSLILIGIMSSYGIFGLFETWTYIFLGLIALIPNFFSDSENTEKTLLTILSLASLLSILISEKSLDIGVFLIFTVFFLWARIKK